MTTYESDNTQGKQRERKENILLICPRTDCQNVLLLKPSILKFKLQHTNQIPMWTDSMWTPASWNTADSSRNQHCISPTTTVQVRTNESSGWVVVPSSAHTNKLSKSNFQKGSHRRHQLSKQKKEIQGICLSLQWPGTLTHDMVGNGALKQSGGLDRL